MSYFFVHFLSFFAQLRGETSSSGAMEEVNTILWNSTAGKFNYQRKLAKRMEIGCLLVVLHYMLATSFCSSCFK